MAVRLQVNCREHPDPPDQDRPCVAAPGRGLHLRAGRAARSDQVPRPHGFNGSRVRCLSPRLEAMEPPHRSPARTRCRGLGPFLHEYGVLLATFPSRGISIHGRAGTARRGGLGPMVRVSARTSIGRGIGVFPAGGLERMRTKADGGRLTGMIGVVAHRTAACCPLSALTASTGKRDVSMQQRRSETTMSTTRISRSATVPVLRICGIDR